MAFGHYNPANDWIKFSSRTKTDRPSPIHNPVCERLLILRCKLDIFEKCQMGVPYKALHAGCVDIKLISLVRTLAFQNAFISLRRK